MNRRLILFTMFATLLAGARAQTIVNGGFEADSNLGTNGYTPSFGTLAGVTGWTFGGSASPSFDGLVAVGMLNVTAPPEGVHAAFIEGTGFFSQAIAFPAGTYTLSFYAEARVPSLGPSPLSIKVNGTTLTFSSANTYTPPSSSSFTLASSDPFTVAAGTWTLEFNGTVPYGGSDLTTFVDNVSISAIPEPATDALLCALAALGVAAFVRQRLKSAAPA